MRRVSCCQKEIRGLDETWWAACRANVITCTFSLLLYLLLDKHFQRNAVILIVFFPCPRLFTYASSLNRLTAHWYQPTFAKHYLRVVVKDYQIVGCHAKASSDFIWLKPCHSNESKFLAHQVLGIIALPPPPLPSHHGEASWCTKDASQTIKQVLRQSHEPRRSS